jgi:hypothetical protein
MKVIFILFFIIIFSYLKNLKKLLFVTALLSILYSLLLYDSLLEEILKPFNNKSVNLLYSSIFLISSSIYFFYLSILISVKILRIFQFNFIWSK